MKEETMKLKMLPRLVSLADKMDDYSLRCYLENQNIPVSALQDALRTKDIPVRIKQTIEENIKKRNER